MTQEDKKLLLQDLCARLPHKVVVDYGYNAFDVRNGNYVKHGSKCILKCYLLDVFMSPRQNEKGEYIKPYLRPMSSMTEEELYEIQEILGKGVEIRNVFISIIDSSINSFSYLELQAVFDWLNAHHFDYRGLIERELAIVVTKENNPYENI